jgi:hypothetical protein
MKHQTKLYSFLLFSLVILNSGINSSAIEPIGPPQPGFLGEFEQLIIDDFNNEGPMVMYNNYSFVGKNTGGYQLIDCRSSSMVLVGTYLSTHTINDMYIDSDTLYIATTTSMWCIDIRNITIPVQRGEIPFKGTKIAGLSGNHLFMVNENYLFCMDVTDGGYPSTLSTTLITTDSSDPIQTAVYYNSYVYVITKYGTVLPLEVTNPAAPQKKPAININDLEFIDEAAIHNGILVLVGEVAGASGNIAIIDTSNPQSLNYLGYYSNTGGCWDLDISFQGDYFWVGSCNLYLYNYNTTTSQITEYQIFSGTDSHPEIVQVQSHNGWLYLLQGQGSKKIERIETNATGFPKSRTNALLAGTATTTTLTTTGSITASGSSGSSGNSNSSTNTSTIVPQDNPFNSVDGYSAMGVFTFIGFIAVLIEVKRKRKFIK